MIYTYTERRDMIGYECFVGMITAKGDIYLREAGHNCERGQVGVFLIIMLNYLITKNKHFLRILCEME